MGAGTCGACGSIKTWTTMITLVAIVLGCIGVVVVIYRTALALAEFILKLLGFQLKICFAQAQILAQIPIMLETLLPSGLQAFFEKLEVVNLNPLNTFGASCSDPALRSFRWTLIAAVTIPVILSAVLIASFTLAARALKYDKTRCYQRYFRLQVLLLYLVLPTVSTTCFRAFLCDEDFGVDGKSFLKADYGQSCASDGYRGVVALAACGVVLYPIGINVATAMLLWRHREGILHHNGDGASHLAFIFAAYKPEAFYFELVDSARRIALTGLLVFIPEKSRASAAMLIAMLFYGVFAEAQPFSNHSLHVVAGVSNAAIACIFACLAILQGEMMPRPLLTTGCVALSWVVIPLLLVFQLVRTKRRSDMCSALHHRESVTHKPEELSLVTTSQFRETFADAWEAGPTAQMELRAQVMEWFHLELGHHIIYDENWDEIVALLEVAAPFNDVSAEHEQGDMFCQIQAIAKAHKEARVEETRGFRDASLAAATEASQATVASLEAKFGEIKSPLPEAFAAAVLGLVAPEMLGLFRDKFDEDLHLTAMIVVAQSALPFFSDTLQRLYPSARLIADVREMRDDEHFALLIAPVKNAERTREKIREARKEFGGDVSKLRLVEMIGDLLRASIVCRTMDDFSSAWNTLSSGFDVRPGHGRLKNNLFVEALRPPDLLVNVVVEPPGSHPLVGEVQIHLREVLLLKEDAIHRLYEIMRASSIDVLLAEAASKKQQKTRRNSRRISRASDKAKPAMLVADDSAPTDDVELVIQDSACSPDGGV